MAGSRSGIGAYLVGAVVGLFFSLVLAGVLSLVAPPPGGPETAMTVPETAAPQAPQPAPETAAPETAQPEPAAPEAAQPDPAAPAPAQPAPQPEPAPTAAEPAPQPQAEAPAPETAEAERPLPESDPLPALKRHGQRYKGDLSAPVLTIVLEGVGAPDAPIGDIFLLPGPLTLVIDPAAEDAADLAADARDAGFEAMFAVTSNTSSAAALFEGDPPLIGAATLGGDLTESPQLTALAAALAERGMGLLDLTAAGGGAAYRMARSSSLPAAPLGRRFDEVKNSAAVYQALERAAFDARRAGAFVVVARPDPAVLTGLRRWMNVKANKSVDVAPLSAVITKLSR